MKKRGTSNSNFRGSSAARLSRRRYLLRTFASDVGTGCCRCYRCGMLLTLCEITVDRIIPGCKGGKYIRNNIRPACMTCNQVAGGGLRSTR